MPYGNCQNCGDKFLIDWKNRKYCGKPECKAISRKGGIRGPKKDPVPYICLSCKGTFKSPYPRKYCDKTA